MVGGRRTNCFLVVLHGQSAGKLFLLGEEPIRIGRGAECELRLEDEGLSRSHCRLIREDATWLLDDLDSTNGVWIDNEKIDRVELVDGTTFKVGPAVIRFLVRTVPSGEGGFTPPDQGGSGGDPDRAEVFAFVPKN